MLEQVLASRYQLIQPLVAGGFGQTFLAKDTHLPGHPHCVVKKLEPASNDSNFLAIARRLFNSEAEALQKVGVHAQIPALLAYFEQDKEFYLVQEFIQGKTLKEALSPGTCWQESEVITLLQDCLGVLDFVHSHGVIHRDIKPANLMLRQEDGKVVLLDFGAVKQISVDQTQVATPTVAIGTQGYMPDEQLGGRPNFTSDLYALGMIGIQALTGIEPASLPRGDDDEIVWHPQATVRPELIAVLSQMICRDYRQRYQCAKEVLEVLKTIALHSPPVGDTDLEKVDPLGPTQVTARTNGKTTVPTAATISQGPVDPLDPISHPASTRVQANGSEVQADSVPSVDAEKSAPTHQETATALTQPVLPLSSSAAAAPSGQTLAQGVESGNVTARPGFQWQISTKVAVISLILLLGGGAVGGIYFTRRATLTKALDRLDSLNALYDQAKYAECVSEAKVAIAEAEIPNAFIKEPIARCQVGQLESLHAQEQYNECVSQAEAAIADEAIPNTTLEEPMARCQLGAAQVQADQSSFAGAIEIATQIPQENPHYQDAQQKIDTWSTGILEYATQTYEEQGKLEVAIAAVNRIPSTTAVAEAAAQKTKQWQANNKANSELISAAEADLRKGLAEKAIAKAEKVTAPQYWRQKADQIKQEAQQQIARRLPPAPAPRWQPAPRRKQRAYTPPRRQAPPPRQQAPPPRQQAPAQQPARKPVQRVCPGPLCVQ